MPPTELSEHLLVPVRSLSELLILWELCFRLLKARLDPRPFVGPELRGPIWFVHFNARSESDFGAMEARLGEEAGLGHDEKQYGL